MTNQHQQQQQQQQQQHNYTTQCYVVNYAKYDDNQAGNHPGLVRCMTHNW